MSRKHPLIKYQIWIGLYHLGQGSEPPTEPEMVGEEEAPNFKVACYLHELKSSLKRVERIIKADQYVDHQDCHWFYSFDRNSNSWTGKYFETKQEALKTFEK